MYDPEWWTIYDSRVAAALAKLVGRWRRTEGGAGADHLLLFGLPAGRGGRRGDVESRFPMLATPNQLRLNFIYASWLMRLIAAEVSVIESPIPGGNWAVVHVEMVLFMLGKEGVEWPD